MMDVSIISINFNNSNLTKNFVESVIKFTSKSIKHEIIIVDNCSELNDFKNLKKVLKPFDVKIIRSKINLGFGGGNMLGVQFASGKYFAFINNDVLFIEDSLSILKDFLEVNPKIGIAGPQQLDAERKPAYSFDHFHGIRKLIFGTRMVEMTSKVPKRKKIIYNSIFPVDLVLGSFMFIRSDMFSKIGGFDTNIFFYYEEMDICYRAKKIGYSSYINPNTSYIHMEGSSTSPKYIIKKERNLSRLYVLKKNHNYLKYFTIRVLFLIKWFFKALLNFKYFNLVFDIVKGSYSESSLKHQQKINLK